jgi:hypothetical protein
VSNHHQHGRAGLRGLAACAAICGSLLGCGSDLASNPIDSAELRDPEGSGAGLAADAGLDLWPETLPPDMPDPAPSGPPRAPTVPDWSRAVSTTVLGANQQPRFTLHALIQDEWLFVFVDRAASDRTESFYNLFIDTDNDPKTSYMPWAWPASSGAEVLVSGGRSLPYKPTTGVRNGTDWGWDDTAATAVYVSPEAATPAGQGRAFEIPLSALNASAQRGIGLGYQVVYTMLDGETSAPSEQVPAPRPTFLRIAPQGSPPYDLDNCRYTDTRERPTWQAPSCPSGYPTRVPEPTAEPIGVSGGAIVPAYIPTSPQAEAEVNWTRIKRGAELAARTNGSRRDYWVAINGPNPGGPPKEWTDWAPYLTHWTQLETYPNLNVFGYVYACEGKCEGSANLRPMQDVMNDITRWICGYPKLSGIWIDEYYPQYELSNIPDRTVIPNLPETDLRAPSDRCAVTWDGKNNGAVQVKPAGGYFDVLTKWINATYPNLKIIGNAGGPLVSNFADYAGLVDVIVGYENSYQIAITGGESGRDKLAPSPRGKSGQLALFHGTSQSEMESIFATATSPEQGYTHFYATDLLYANGVGNPWGGTASYFEAQMELIFPQP